MKIELVERNCAQPEELPLVELDALKDNLNKRIRARGVLVQVNQKSRFVPNRLRISGANNAYQDIDVDPEIQFDSMFGSANEDWVKRRAVEKATGEKLKSIDVAKVIHRNTISTAKIQQLSEKGVLSHSTQIPVAVLGELRIQEGTQVELDGVPMIIKAGMVTAMFVDTVRTVQPACIEISDFHMRMFPKWAKKSMADILRDIRNGLRMPGLPDDFVLATLLCYHSPIELIFKGVELERSWMEVLVLGEPAVGKSTLCERLQEKIGLGSFQSGESATRTGLSFKYKGGGTEVEWGILPRNDKGLIILDEANQINKKTIEQLNNIRSHGRALASGCVEASADARTRIIWLANPPEGMSVGIEALRKIFPGAVNRRFDLVVPMRQVIGESSRPSDDSTFLSFFLASHVKWAWSRRAKDFTFTEPAVTSIEAGAKQLADAYGHAPGVTLCQAGEMPYKLARISASYALLAHSSPDNERVIIHEAHVQDVIALIHRLYGTSGLALDNASASARGLTRFAPGEIDRIESDIKTAIDNERTNARMFKKKGSVTQALLRLFLHRNEASPADIKDILADQGLETSDRNIRNKTEHLRNANLVKRDGQRLVRTDRLWTLLLRLRDQGVI